MLGGLLALAGTSWAQGVPPAGEETTKTKVKTTGDMPLGMSMSPSTSCATVMGR